MQQNYLDWISKYRKEGLKIYFQDEAWMFKNISRNKFWKDVAPEVIE